ncbi:hypothetical protein DV737_g607, partial [Chaetothyriales sp. CBS 132003]
MDTSYLTQQVNTIIGQLHTIWDEIGLPRNDRDSRETELFAALSETLHNQLRVFNSEKSEMTEEANNLIKTIQQMEASLDDEKDRMGYDLDTRGLRVTFPLNECIRELKEKYNTVSRLHRERFEQVKKLVLALESYSSHLESSFVKIRLPPTNAASCPPTFDLSPSYVATLDEEFTRIYDEYGRRLKLVQTTAEEMVRLWSELGIPQAQTDSSIVQHYRDSPEQLGLHQSDLDRLKSRRDKLLDEKRNREKRLAEMRKSIEGLWDRLGIEDADRKAFLAANRGCGLRAINEYEDELARLNELKRQNLHLFVEDARVRLQELWDQLYFSEEEMLDFTPAFSDVYSDALLSAHEAEIERLATLKDQRTPILEAIDKHKSLLSDKKALEESANDASRLMLKPQKGERRDPGKLLREEKMRKRIAKELPKVTASLIKTLEKYEDEYGRPFLVHGQRYIDEIEQMDAKPPPARSKTPNGIAPRPKTPGAMQPAKPASAASRSQPSRPQSSMRNHAPSKSVSKTPTIGRAGLSRSQIATTAASSSVSSAAPSTQSRSPSRIPARVPLANLHHGGNSPERHHHAPQQQTNYAAAAATARTTGPPRAPPPKMRDLFQEPSAPQLAQPPHLSRQHLPPRPESTLSASSSGSSRFVQAVPPEDVYDDRERMSYMSTSLLDRNHQYQYRQHQLADPQPQRLPEQFHASASRSQLMPPPPRPDSRQASNSSSSMTVGTTAASSTSENWETYSDLRKDGAIAPLICILLLIALSLAYIRHAYHQPKVTDIISTRPLSPFVKDQAKFWQSLYTAILSNDPECEESPIEPVVPHKLDIGFNPSESHARPDLLWIRPADLNKLKDSHTNFVNELPEISPPFFLPASQGIAVTAGLKQLPVLTISLRMLRRTGCELPVEVFLASDEDYDSHLCTEVFPSLNAQCLIFTDIFREAETGVSLDHYQFKIFALIFASFDDVLLLDSDAFPATDPTTIFTSEPFTSQGMILWPDFWYPSESPYFFEIANLGTPPPLNAYSSIESGELMVSKSKHSLSLMLAAYYNYYGPSYYYPLQSQGAPGQGDKETFGWAALATNNSFYHVHERVIALGHVDSTNKFYGSAMAQHDPVQDFHSQQVADQSSALSDKEAAKDPDDQASGAKSRVAPLFVHANFPKFDPATLFEFSTQAKGTVGPTFDSNNTAIRTWGPRPEMVKLFGFDIEHAFWEEIEYVACNLESDFVAWKGKQDICFGVQEYMKIVFPT